MMLVAMFVTIAMTAIVGLGRWARNLRFPRNGWWRQFAQAALDDLVEFSPIQPDPAALRTVIDFNTLTFCHEQISGGTNWTFHAFPFLQATSVADYMRFSLSSP